MVTFCFVVEDGVDEVEPADLEHFEQDEHCWVRGNVTEEDEGEGEVEHPPGGIGVYVVGVGDVGGVHDAF